jgi:hypothetical protein
MDKVRVLQGFIVLSIHLVLSKLVLQVRFAQVSEMLIHCRVNQGHTMKILHRQAATLAQLEECALPLGSCCQDFALQATCAMKQGKLPGQSFVLLDIGVLLGH